MPQPENPIEPQVTAPSYAIRTENLQALKQVLVPQRILTRLAAACHRWARPVRPIGRRVDSGGSVPHYITI
jgi:hypothetical protein